MGDQPIAGCVELSDRANGLYRHHFARRYLIKAAATRTMSPTAKNQNRPIMAIIQPEPPMQFSNIILVLHK